MAARICNAAAGGARGGRGKKGLDSGGGGA
jgi:hypothetical protein